MTPWKRNYVNLELQHRKLMNTFSSLDGTLVLVDRTSDIQMEMMMKAKLAAPKETKRQHYAGDRGEGEEILITMVRDSIR
jgi:hypothetical protein